MNKLALLFISILIITSCNKDENIDTKQKNYSIEGVWKVTKREDISGKDKTTILKSIDNECIQKQTFEFKKTDFKFIEYFPEDPNCKETNIVNGKYEFDQSSKKIYLGEKKEFFYNVEKLTDKELVIFMIAEDANDDEVRDYARYYTKKQL